LPAFEVTALDIAILLSYVLLSRVFFGWYCARKTKGEGSESFFLDGRSLRWSISGLSFYVANMSGGSFIGLPSAGYEYGIAVYLYEIVPAFVLIAFVFIFLPRSSTPRSSPQRSSWKSATAGACASPSPAS